MKRMIDFIFHPKKNPNYEALKNPECMTPFSWLSYSLPSSCLLSLHLF